MFDLLKLLLYQAIYYLARSVPASKKTNHLLLVKVDEIGDYVLIRNCLSYFRNSSVYKNHRITFVGNKIFRQLYEQYDRSVADETLWIDKRKYRRNPFYRFQIFRDIRRKGYSDAVNLIYSRSWRLDDVLISVSGASTRIGMINDAAHMTPLEKLLRSKNIYTRLVETGDDNTFDSLRNARFISNLIGAAVPATTQIAESPVHGLLKDEVNYCVIFPGSGIASKKWSPQNFSRVATHLLHKWELNIVVCGSDADKNEGDKFINEILQPVHNLIGKTTLPELISVLRSSKCLVSVDTGVVHLAAAVGCPVFGLFNGLHYGRFAPYPPEIAINFFPIYPDKVDLMIADGSIDDRKVSMGFVKSISAEKVINTIDAFFKKQHN